LNSSGLNYSGPVLAPYRLPFAHSVAQGGSFFFLLFIFMLPFQRAIFLKENLFDIQGLKPFNLLAAIVLAYLVFQSAPLHATDKIEQRSIRIFLLYFATFAIAVIRSIPNAPVFHNRFPISFPDSYLDYTLSYCIVPALYTLPFLFVLKRMCSFRELERLTTVICLSILLLSVAFVVAVLIAGGGSRGEINALCETYFGFHYNTIGTIYICTAPLLLYRALTGRALWIIPLALSLLAILLLQSRSTLVTVAVTYSLFLIQRRSFAILMLGVTVVGIAALFLSASTFNSLLSIGFAESSETSADAVLTGRVDSIWIPLLNEWTSDIGLFVVGAGRSGMMTSQLWDTGVLIQATHAHNAIINFFLDCGVILSGVLIVLLLVGIATAWRVGRGLNSDLYWALFACVFGFGIGTMTDREILPTAENMHVFPIVAMMINVARLRYLFQLEKRRDGVLPTKMRRLNQLE
jgi:hypothetical protein